jgi:hypothetical protein
MLKVADTFKQLHLAFGGNNFPSFCLKPQQVQCFEYMLRGCDVISILLAVLVVSPLSSIIEDHISALKTIGIAADVFPMENSAIYKAESLFEHTDGEKEKADET